MGMPKNMKRSFNEWHLTLKDDRQGGLLAWGFYLGQESHRLQTEGEDLEKFKKIIEEIKRDEMNENIKTILDFN